jgi:predicted dehydrogenase
MNQIDRRGFLKRAVTSTSSATAAFSLPTIFAGKARGERPAASKSKLGRPGIGAIGLRYQGSVIAVQAKAFGDIVAVCDVDRNVRDQAKASFGSTPQAFEDYRDLLARKEVDIVTIGSPDHWHVKMAIDALRASKGVYVEKPIGLTIDEGKLLRKVAMETGGVLQVGSWQRSDARFRLAVEMVRQGRIGRLQQVEVVLGKNAVGGPFPQRAVPNHLNWNLWQGQALDRPYLEQRCHYTFRWWYDYAGGQMTDWGAHHIDIAQWAIGAYPLEVSGRGKLPTQTADSYNVPIDFHVSYKYPENVTLTVSDTGRNGILFTGEAGRIFVNRGVLEGKPIDELKSNPLAREQFILYDFANLQRPERAGKLDAITNHMGNFIDCWQAGKTPISDFESQHRSATTCHLGNISLRLGRSLKWDSTAEAIVGDDEANGMLSRQQRPGFEVI